MKHILALGWAVSFLLGVAFPAPAQEKAIIPDLKALADGKGGKAGDGIALAWVANVKGKPALKVGSKMQGGMVLLEGIEFTDGVIEFDALGQSGPPQSNFLGIAFRVQAGERDVVYFRPFNFRAEDQERRSHAVQYVSEPKYPWQALRKEKPGQYEKSIDPAPDGDEWFRAKIVIEKPKVRVYVNGAKEQSLVVEELNDRNGGGIGLWIGPGHGGHFANLTITPKK